MQCTHFHNEFRCEIDERSYLCWTISPEISCVIEYFANKRREKRLASLKKATA